MVLPLSMRTWARRKFFGTDSLEMLNQCGLEDALIDQSGDQLRERAWRDKALKVSGFSSPAYACSNPAARQAERSATTSARLSGGVGVCAMLVCVPCDLINWDTRPVLRGQSRQRYPVLARLRAPALTPNRAMLRGLSRARRRLRPLRRRRW